MDVYKLLHQDHLKVKGIFGELEDTTERAVKKRSVLFEELNAELTLHAAAEERFLYPRLKKEDPTHDLTLEAVEEHAVVKRLLKELSAQDVGTEEWAAKLKVLRENVEHHVEEEEQELFKKAKKALTDEEAEAIGGKIESFKEEQIASMGA